MANSAPRIVEQYAKMWPRELFDVKTDKAILNSIPDSLNGAGVYVLYRDDIPYYIGKSKNCLFKRIQQHAVNPRDRYFNFWNFFSAFVVPEPSHIDEVEGILITSMQTENHAVPRIQRIKLPLELGRLLVHARRDRVARKHQR